MGLEVGEPMLLVNSTDINGEPTLMAEEMEVTGVDVAPVDPEVSILNLEEPCS